MKEDMQENEAEKILPAAKISIADVPMQGKGGFDIQRIIPSEAGLGFNALRVHVHGEHPRKRMLGTTTRIYHVLEGSGTFTLNAETHTVVTGDTFIIPPGNEYEYSGDMTMFEFNVSPDNVFTDQVTYEKGAQ